MDGMLIKHFEKLLRQPVLAHAAVAVLTLGAAGGSACAQAASTRHLITADLVIAAMTARQLPTDAVQIKLAAPITSSSSNPSLRIEAITRTGERGSQLRMVCQTKQECLPFYVAVTWPQSSAPGVSAALAQATSVKGRSAEPVQMLKPMQESSGSAMIRSGAHATLLIEDEKIHIRLQVVCLEDGVTGAKIRVASPDRKQSYHAEVLAPDLLKGSF